VLLPWRAPSLAYDEATGEYRIRYDDNEFEDVTLPDDTVRYEMATMA
jgi:hypothetical protein